MGYGIPNFEIALSLGFTDQFTKQLDFEIFPNPATSNLFIKYPDSIPTARVAIHNVLGQLVYENQLESMQPVHVWFGLGTESFILCSDFMNFQQSTIHEQFK